MKFKTENLYLVKVCDIVKVDCYGSKIERTYKNSGRFTLAYLVDGRCDSFTKFEDVFTHSAYPVIDNVLVSGISTVIEARSIITNCKYITEEEALHILKELNPTYLKDVNSKRLHLFRK